LATLVLGVGEILIEIVNADCTTAFNSSEFDVMITDPPYSEHVHANATSQSRGGGTRARNLGFDFLSANLRHYIAGIAGKCVKRWSLIYSDIEGLHDWKTACELAGAKYIRPMPWVRWSMPQLSGDRPPTGCEFITCYWGTQGGRKSWNGPGNLISLNHTCLRGEGKHKTEKPLDQMLDLVTWFSNPGDHVFDPCVGSGTTALACSILNRNFTGVEIDKEWAEKARERIYSPLSDRDQDRYDRWCKSQEVQWEERQRLKKHTAKVRAKLDENNA